MSNNNAEYPVFRFNIYPVGKPRHKTLAKVASKANNSVDISPYVGKLRSLLTDSIDNSWITISKQTDPDYNEYKEKLIGMLKSNNVSPDQYDTLEANFFFPFPRSASKKNRVDGALHTTNPQLHVLCDGLKAALHSAGIIETKSQLAKVGLGKYYTTEDQGYIIMRLSKSGQVTSDDVLPMRKSNKKQEPEPEGMEQEQSTSESEVQSDD